MTRQSASGTNLRVGVVGVGHLGQHHARVLAAIPGVTLVGVADSRPEQARLVAERLGTRAVDDYRDLLDRVDAVSVAVPTSLHREVAGAFLDRGIATMVEKPLAANFEDALAIVELARSRGAVLQVGHIERFNPAFQAIDGLPLAPRFLSCERLSTYTFRSTDVGVVLDLMIHDIDLVLALVDSPVRSVSAVGVSVFGGHEDMADARVEFVNGCVANLSASRASYQAARKMRVYSAEGYVSLDFATKQVTTIQPSERLRQGELALEGLDLSQAAAVKERVFGTILNVHKSQAEGREPLALELEDFVEAVRTGNRPRVAGDDALRAMHLADQVLRSLHSHSWVAGAEEPAASFATPGGASTVTTTPMAGHPLAGPVSWRLQSARETKPTTQGA